MQYQNHSTNDKVFYLQHWNSMLTFNIVCCVLWERVRERKKTPLYIFTVWNRYIASIYTMVVSRSQCSGMKWYGILDDRSNMVFVFDEHKWGEKERKLIEKPKRFSIYWHKDRWFSSTPTSKSNKTFELCYRKIK